ncbi:MAG TPA: helix-turn-helix domain-containing protein [Acidimicrobiia bacterium]|nr:helix-turn-helix domain-containing protein [Acidimicrobiia bacterium]
MSHSSLDSLDRSIGDLAASLGDPTRRGIYLAVRQSPDPVTSSQVAGLFSIHPNVARHHLDRLADDGYLQVTHQRRSGRSGPGAGRPAKCYEATSKGVSLHPGRRYDLLVELLVRVLDDVKPEGVSAIAEKVGRAYGQELAASIGGPEEPGYEEALSALVKVMSGVGFEVSADADAQVLLTSHCPFGEAATGHPEVVCSLDRGMVAGILGSMRHACSPVVIPHHELGEDCVTRVPVSIIAKA